MLLLLCTEGEKVEEYADTACVYWGSADGGI